MKKLLKLWKKYSFVLLMAFLLLGLVDFRIAIGAIIFMMGPIVVSLFRGRFWCGNICPRGSFYDTVMSKFSKDRKVPAVLKSTWFRLLIFVMMMSVFALGIKNSNGNLFMIGQVFYRMIFVTTLVGVVMTFVYNHRTWCHFCPMGSIASLVSKIRKSNMILNVSQNCVSCRKCETRCPIGIVPYEYKGNLLSHQDCIQCGNCVTACRLDAIAYNKEEDRCLNF